MRARLLPAAVIVALVMLAAPVTGHGSTAGDSTVCPRHVMIVA